MEAMMTANTEALRIGDIRTFELEVMNFNRDFLFARPYPGADCVAISRSAPSRLISPAVSDQGKQAVIDVLAERRRQVEAEGWTAAHDDGHRHGEMAVAAACYALSTADDSDGPEVRLVGAELWPWADEWWKPKDRRHDLVRAAALLLAEIERLDRITIKGGDVG
jgi:hypothetical protein